MPKCYLIVTHYFDLNNGGSGGCPRRTSLQRGIQPWWFTSPSQGHQTHLCTPRANIEWTVLSRIFLVEERKSRELGEIPWMQKEHAKLHDGSNPGFEQQTLELSSMKSTFCFSRNNQMNQTHQILLVPTANFFFGLVIDQRPTHCGQLSSHL